MVIRHLCSLLGYNQTNRTFIHLPSKIRWVRRAESLLDRISNSSRRRPVFHAFIANVPKLVDYNFSLGTVLLPFFLSFLQFSTCSNASMQFYEHIAASNTLGRIDPSLRDSWLLTLIIILYKVDLSCLSRRRLTVSFSLQYQYSNYTNTIQHLTRIAMNTILSHYHLCESGPFGVTSGGHSGRMTPKVAGSRRGACSAKDRGEAEVEESLLFRLITSLR